MAAKQGKAPDGCPKAEGEPVSYPVQDAQEWFLNYKVWKQLHSNEELGRKVHVLKAKLVRSGKFFPRQDISFAFIDDK